MVITMENKKYQNIKKDVAEMRHPSFLVVVLYLILLCSSSKLECLVACTSDNVELLLLSKVDELNSIS